MAALAAAGVDNDSVADGTDGIGSEHSATVVDSASASRLTDAQREALWNDVRVSVKQLNSPVLLRRVLAAATLVEVDLGVRRLVFVALVLAVLARRQCA